MDGLLTEDTEVWGQAGGPGSGGESVPVVEVMIQGLARGVMYVLKAERR